MSCQAAWRGVSSRVEWVGICGWTAELCSDTLCATCTPRPARQAPQLWNAGQNRWCYRLPPCCVRPARPPSTFIYIDVYTYTLHACVITVGGVAAQESPPESCCVGPHARAASGATVPYRSTEPHPSALPFLPPLQEDGLPPPGLCRQGRECGTLPLPLTPHVRLL